MTSYGYIIVDLCIISFDLKCIMQFNQLYNIATKVSSRKKCYYFWWSTWLITGTLWKSWILNLVTDGFPSESYIMMTSSNGNISLLLAICAGNSPVTGEFPTRRPVTRSFDVFFDLRLNKRLIKQSSDWWFETPSRLLWRHCNVSLAGAGDVINVSISWSLPATFS